MCVWSLFKDWFNSWCKDIIKWETKGSNYQSSAHTVRSFCLWATNKREGHISFISQAKNQRKTLIHSQQTVVLELIVAGQSDEASPAWSKGEEDLYGGVPPYPRLQQLVETRGEVVQDAVHRARQGESTDQQDEQHQVREGGSQVHSLVNERN